MRSHCVVLATFLVAASPFKLSSQTAEEQQRFAGAWQAKFKDVVICTIKIESGEHISGATYGCSIHVNDDGDLIETQAPENSEEPSAIVNAKVEADKLSFDTKDGDDMLKFEFTLKGERRAELRFVDAPVKIKPIRFDKR
jgi:hypothetical protein